MLKSIGKQSVESVESVSHIVSPTTGPCHKLTGAVFRVLNNVLARRKWHGPMLAAI